MTRRGIIGIAILVIVLGGVLLYFLMPAPSGTQTQNPGGNPFGTPAGTVPGSTGGSSQGSTTELTTSSGQTIAVPDLTAGKTGFPIGSHEFYFVTNNQDTEGDAAEYDILYGTDSSITIGLLREPLGAARLAAEAKLRSILGLPDAQICALKVSVQVPYSVNQFYAGTNLGLSFCPRSTELPR